MNDQAMTTSKSTNAPAQNDSRQVAQSQQQAKQQQQQQYILPRVDVVEDTQGITLLADLPGVKREGLDLKVDGTNLLLEGAIEIDAPSDLDALFAEVRAARYRRAFALSNELDTSKIDAQLKDGVLRLRIPKVAEAQPRRIEVRVA